VLELAQDISNHSFCQSIGLGYQYTKAGTVWGWICYPSLLVDPSLHFCAYWSSKATIVLLPRTLASCIMILGSISVSLTGLVVAEISMRSWYRVGAWG
jgi:hypothetical protein